MKNAAKLLAGLLLAAFLFWLVLRGTDLGEVRRALASASIPLLVIGAVVNASHNVFRVLRWKVLLRPSAPRVPLTALAGATFIGYMTTLVVPGRIGEVVRPALASARHDVPLGPSLGSVLADRLLDAVAIVVLFAVGIAFAPLHGDAAQHAPTFRRAAVALVAVTVVTLGVLMALSAHRAVIGAWLERRNAVARWIGRSVLAVAEGTEALRDLKLLPALVVHSLLAWLTIVLGTWLGIRAAGVDVSYAAVLVIMPLLAFGIALPTPGMAGGYHAAMAWGLTTLFGQVSAIANAAGILMHLGVTLPLLLLGLVFLRVEGIAWRDVLTAARQVGNLGRNPRAPEADR